MKNRIIAFLLVMMTVLSMTCAVYAAETTSTAQTTDVQTSAEVVNKPKTLTSKVFTLYVDVRKPAGTIKPSDLRFNIYTEDGVWLQNKCHRIEKTGRISIEFQLPEYESGTKFLIAATTGVENVGYCGKKYGLGEKFLVDTYGYKNEAGEAAIYNSAYISAQPFVLDAWKEKAEKFINSKNVSSSTSYLVWVSKANYKVTVFLRKNGKWECVKYFGCSIGAPGSPTVTGTFKYYQYQPKWYYDSFYVGPVMRFYNGYAIHSTLIRYNGTPYDARIGKQISHGCVRVLPENMNWLVNYVKLNSTVYVTNS